MGSTFAMMIRRLPVLLAGFLSGVACSPVSPVKGTAPSASASTASLSSSAGATPPAAPEVASAAAPAPSAGDAGAAPDPAAISVARAEEILFLRSANVPSAAGACPRDDREGAIRCLLGLRFEGDAEAARAAIELYAAAGSVAGVEPEQVMDGGFRGQLRLVPEVPVGPHRRHLLWTLAASLDFELFFTGIAGAAPSMVRYRSRHIAYRFFRSVKRTTPSAYAQGWTVAYNVSGSLHGSAAAVRETLFHEIFHLNDADHGDWSARALGGVFNAIVKKCGTNVACHKPYAPADTMVKGGTYYAFQPDNGEAVHEYAAELASRYYREHRAIFRKEPPFSVPFKCGPDENKRAWEAMAREFFGGADLTAACPR
jgi:hypothetical protein